MAERRKPKLPSSTKKQKEKEIIEQKVEEVKEEVVEPKKRKSKEEKETGTCVMQCCENCKRTNGKRVEGKFYTLKEEQGNIDFFKGIQITTYRGTIKNYIPVCKDCIKEYCYNDKGEVIIERFRNLLMLCNLPFIEKVFTESVSSDMDTIGSYFARIGLPQYKMLKWLDGEYFKLTKMTIQEEEVEMTYDMKKLKKKWGRSYSEDDLEMLEDWYVEALEHCENAESYGTQEMVKMYCRSKMDVELKRMIGQSTKDSETAVAKYMDKLCISPDKIKEIKNSHNFIREIADIEEKKPADLFWTKIYKDVDQLGIYFKKFFLRPAKNLITNSRDFSDEYRVDDEDGFLEIEEYDDSINILDIEEIEAMEKENGEDNGK
jgi:hypothetical protein